MPRSVAAHKRFGRPTSYAAEVAVRPGYCPKRHRAERRLEELKVRPQVKEIGAAYSPCRATWAVAVPVCETNQVLPACIRGAEDSLADVSTEHQRCSRSAPQASRLSSDALDGVELAPISRARPGLCGYGQCFDDNFRRACIMQCARRCASRALSRA